MSQLFDDDQEIIDRMTVLESEGFPSDECISFAWALVKCQPGEVAEKAVRCLVDSFPDDRLNDLVRKHVWRGVVPGFDYCDGLRAGLLAAELAAPRLGFAPVVSGWRVGWPGGEVLEGRNLCRLALLAVWLRRMRGEEPEG